MKPDGQRSEQPTESLARTLPRSSGLLNVSPLRWNIYLGATLAVGLTGAIGLTEVGLGTLPGEKEWPAPVHVVKPLETPPPPADLVERGAHLYAANGCFGCHGARGSGGVENPNAIGGWVPAVDHLDERLLLFEPEHVDWVIDRFERGLSVTEPGQAPPFRNHHVFAAQVRMLRELILKGNPATQLDSAAPPPPLHMPPWAGRLDDRDIDALIVYLLKVSRQRSERESP